MFVIKKLRLNKFEARPIVSNRALFQAIGEKPASIQSKDTSDCYNEPTVEGATKTKVLGFAQEIAAKAYEMKETNGNAEQLNVNVKDR